MAGEFRLPSNHPASDRAVLRVIEGFATRSKSGVAFPSMVTIMRETGIRARSTVCAALDRLAPYVQRERSKYRNRDGWRHNVYRPVGAFASHCRRKLAARAKALAARAQRFADDVAASIERGREAVRRQAVNAYRAAIFRKRQATEKAGAFQAGCPISELDLSKTNKKKDSWPVSASRGRRMSEEEHNRLEREAVERLRARR